MRNIDFTSWQSLLATLLGLVLVTLLGVGIRLVMMVTIQQRRERMNRQINERLRTLIAAYKTLGGSFTGNLMVDPRHLRDLREAPGGATGTVDLSEQSERGRRIRDTVEAALADILLLGTEEHVRLAEHAARELVAGRQVPTQPLVVSLRDFIRHALDLDPIPAGLAIPVQGPSRQLGSGRGKGESGGGGAGKGGGGGMGLGAGMGMGGGLGTGHSHEDDTPDHHG
ncbi:hypothetical protein [Sphingomonas sp. PR090111-T3T-6A]|uniref:hypothetical protein n=1 Tax=Sphingomonas sp. PR090111-T3T-6A TaxID=685778 RepID=UPI00037A4434|nr:hypothetical protein [Sphingomonas sp. PR090111-T3T-6A]